MKVSEQSLFQELRNSIPIKKYEKPEVIKARSETSEGSTVSIELLPSELTLTQRSEREEKLEKEVEHMSSEYASMQVLKEDLKRRENTVDEKEQELETLAQTLTKKEEELTVREATLQKKEELLAQRQEQTETLASKFTLLDEREKELEKRERIIEQKTSYYDSIKRNHLHAVQELKRKLEDEKKRTMHLTMNLANASHEIEKLRKIIKMHENTDRELELVFKRKRIQ
jgi:chromosome segregation ATPase